MTYTPYERDESDYMSANEEEARRELHEGTDWDDPDSVAGFYECSRDLDKIFDEQE